jgi:hypothetical protein
LRTRRARCSACRRAQDGCTRTGLGARLVAVRARTARASHVLTRFFCSNPPRLSALSTPLLTRDSGDCSRRIKAPTRAIPHTETRSDPARARSRLSALALPFSCVLLAVRSALLPSHLTEYARMHSAHVLSLLGVRGTPLPFDFPFLFHLHPHHHPHFGPHLCPRSAAHHADGFSRRALRTRTPTRAADAHTRPIAPPLASQDARTHHFGSHHPARSTQLRQRSSGTRRYPRAPTEHEKDRSGG